MQVDIPRLAARAAVCKALEGAPDDMLIDVATFALVRGTTDGTVRQEMHDGRIAVEKIGRKAMLRLGDARRRNGDDAKS